MKRLAKWSELYKVGLRLWVLLMSFLGLLPTFQKTYLLVLTTSNKIKITNNIQKHLLPYFHISINSLFKLLLGTANFCFSGLWLKKILSVGLIFNFFIIRFLLSSTLKSHSSTIATKSNRIRNKVRGGMNYAIMMKIRLAKMNRKWTILAWFLRRMMRRC